MDLSQSAISGRSPFLENLAAGVRKPSKSLHRMLGPHGNPSTENFFGIVSALQKETKVRLRVTIA
jgi:hypothetical protein